MKRFLSIIISIAMLVCMLPMTGMATTPAADDAEKLVFDMDLSTYATDGNITNSVAGNDTTITFNTNKPIAGAIEGSDKDYLTFRTSADTTNPKNSFKVADAGFINQDKLTVEAWLNPEYWGSPVQKNNEAVFALQGDKNYMDLAKWANSTLTWIADGDTSPQILKKTISVSCAELWTHVVFTREWIPDSAEATTGSWKTTVYFNGENVLTASSETGYTRTVETDNTYLQIGARGDFTFYGSIGDLKVYQSILSEDSVKSKYEVGCADYYPSMPEDDTTKLVFDMDLSKYQNKVVKSNAPYGGKMTITAHGSPTFNVLPSGVPYMSFTKDQYITVKNNKHLVGMEKQTVEYWVRSSKFGGTGSPYKRGWELDTDGMNSSLYFFSYQSLFFEPVGDTSATADSNNTIVPGSLTSDNTNQWTHIVTTKEWDATASGWISNMYINGVKTSGSPRTITSGKSGAAIVAPSAETTAELRIVKELASDIADFKVYESILDEDAVKANYLAEKDMFSEVGNDKLVFDMDLSSSTEDGIVVTSKDSGSGVYTVSGTPTLGTLEGGQKYLTFGSSTKDGIKVADYALTNQNEMTVETWFRPTAFEATGSTDDDQRIFDSSWMISRIYRGKTGAQMWWEPAGDNILRYQNASLGSSTNNKWSHWVFTRRYDASEGKWYGKVYINGKQLGSVEKVVTRANETANVIVIGNNSKSDGNEIAGDFATFKVYNSVLSDKDIMGKYNDTRATFETIGEGNLIFDMDLSEYAADNTVIKNAVKGTADGITVNSAPVLGTLAGGQKYLTFDSLNSEGSEINDAAGIKVTDDIFLNQNEITIETWLKGTNFNKGARTTGSDIMRNSTMLIRQYDFTTASNIWWDPAGDNQNNRKSYGSAADLNNKWTHLVFTRKWDPTTDTWTSEMYINGVEYGSDKVYTPSTTRAAETDNVIIIGNNSSFTNAFEGEMATFKIYNKILDADTIADKFAAERVAFYEMSLSEFTTESTSVTATLSSTLTSQNPFVVMALYESDAANAKMLKAVAGTTLEITEEDNITLQEGYVVKCFVWNNITDLKPLVGAAVATCSQGL